jgi:hypothetical protein
MASKYLLSLRSINDEAEPHDSRTITEENSAFLSRGNHYGCHQTTI